MYQKIAAHPTVREIWARTLVERGVITEEQVEALNKKHTGELQAALDALQPEQDFVEPQPEAPPPGAASKAETAVPLERLRELNASLLTLPSDFTIHRKLERVREKRHTALERAGRADGRLGARRGAGARVDPGRRHQHPADRRGRRARHVQPSPRGVPRRQRPAACTCRCRRCRRRRPPSRSTTAR